MIEVTERTEARGDDLGRLITDPGARVASKRRTPTHRAATTVPGSAKTATPTEETTGNGIGTVEIAELTVEIVELTVEIVEVTVETAADATLMTDLDGTCLTNDLVAVAAKNVTTVTVAIAETGESGGEVLHPRGARSPRPT